MVGKDCDFVRVFASQVKTRREIVIVDDGTRNGYSSQNTPREWKSAIEYKLVLSKRLGMYKHGQIEPVRGWIRDGSGDNPIRSNPGRTITNKGTSNKLRRGCD